MVVAALDVEAVLVGMVEHLAALEHEQWMSWAMAVAPEVSQGRRERWEQYFRPYGDLPDEVKELDRVWARRAIEALVGFVNEWAHKEEDKGE